MVTSGLGYKLESHLLALAFVAQRRVGSVPPAFLMGRKVACISFFITFANCEIPNSICCMINSRSKLFFRRASLVSCLFILMVASPLSAFAKAVPVARAKAEAERFLKEVASMRPSRLQLMFESPRMTKAGPAEPEYFIFSDAQGGYVIAAGDDTVPSILGYSTTGSFQTEEMPENLRGWLDMWVDIVNGERNRGAAPYPQVARVSKGSSKLLKTALWNQGDPFNRHCIIMEEERAVTGCTATAAGILMRYHKWPEKGNGVIPSYMCNYHDKTYTIPSIELGHPYDWNNMPLTAGGGWNSTQIEEVSTLLNELGVMLQSDYSPGATSAYPSDVGAVLSKFMDYDKSYKWVIKRFYPDENEWIALLKDCIDNVGPVFYGGQAPRGGHAFILDGYDANDFFHINWGWGGWGNGYFVMPEFREYTGSQEALVGLKQNAGGICQDNLVLYADGLISAVTDFSVDASFNATCESLLNMGELTFTGEVAFAKFDCRGTMEELVSEAKPLSIRRYHYMDFTLLCVIGTPIKPGDVMKLVYRSLQTPSWTPVCYHEGGTVGTIALGDKLLEEIVSLSYNVSTGILTVSFAAEAECDLRRGAATVSTGVSRQGRKVSIDANQLSSDSYTLHLKRGSQEKDIAVKLGLKK